MTVDGHKPNKNDKTDTLNRNANDGLNEEDYCCLSYKDDIYNWMNDCLEISEGKRIKPLIEQYKEVIRKLSKKFGPDGLKTDPNPFCVFSEEDLEIDKVLSRNKETLELALSKIRHLNPNNDIDRLSVQKLAERNNKYHWGKFVQRISVIV